tara:strand:- start:1564 stop:2025 length:462 start_codon:yes stop_codon:yes gene_type:complete
MKSPKLKGVGEVVTEYGAKVMKVVKEGLLGRSLFDFYGDVKALTFKTKEVTTVPKTPIDGKGGVIYTKSADGKLYYKSNEVLEIELSNTDKHFVHTQGTSSASWVVDHNLKKFPSVTVVDSAGTVVIGQVDYESLNQVTLIFKASFSGKAYFN